MENLQIHYSHGLEAIYQLEKVDPKTIRPFQPSSADFVSAPATASGEYLRPSFPLLGHLPLGPLVEESISSLLPQEPIEVLGFPLSLEQRLHAEGVVSLGDLGNLLQPESSRQAPWIQSHRREIRHRLQEHGFFGAKSQCRKIPWQSIRNILFYSVEPWRSASLFQHYGIPLPRNFLTKGFLEKDPSLLAEWRTGEISSFLKEVLKQMAQAFLLPWMMRRGGFASMEAIGERLFLASDDPAMAGQLLPLLAEICQWEQWAWEGVLPEGAPGIFCTDRFRAADVQKIFLLSRSFFYRAEAEYPFSDLVRLIFRESVKVWGNASVQQIENILASCPLFRISCDRNAKKWVRFEE